MLGTKLTDDLTVMEATNFKISSFPLDYHLHSWQVAQILPYLLDNCDETGQCLMNEYLNLGFAQ